MPNHSWEGSNVEEPGRGTTASEADDISDILSWCKMWIQPTSKTCEPHRLNQHLVNNIRTDVWSTYLNAVVTGLQDVPIGSNNKEWLDQLTRTTMWNNTIVQNMRAHIGYLLIQFPGPTDLSPCTWILHLLNAEHSNPRFKSHIKIYTTWKQHVIANWMLSIHIPD